MIVPLTRAKLLQQEQRGLTGDAADEEPDDGLGWQLGYSHAEVLIYTLACGILEQTRQALS